MSRHCQDEHAGHDEHGNHRHIHDHDDNIAPALQSLLYEQVDFSAVNTLNEATPGAGAAILKKTWTQRLDPEPELASYADEQLLMFIPFTGQVRLHAILLRTSATAAAPKTLKIYLNRDDLDFSTAADLQPIQMLHLSQTNDVQELPVKRALFNTTRSLALFIEDNFGQGDEETTRLSYLAFKGEFMKLCKDPVSVLYEAAANPADHKVKGATAPFGIGNGIGGPSRTGM